ncbi:hypothetical protein GGI35DRAFT_485957 [Trichoderma velutinum]
MAVTRDEQQWSNREPPFNVAVLSDDSNSINPGDGDQYLLSSLPATFRTENFGLASPRRNVIACLEQELWLGALQDVKPSDWIAKYSIPMPARPLHQYVHDGQQIMVTEVMRDHLRRYKYRIHLKPLPRYLLLPQFWKQYLSCEAGCLCMTDHTPTTEDYRCQRRKLREVALGFLYSYACLISYEIDFHLAKDARLVPTDERFTWTRWVALVDQLEIESIESRMHLRFIYGEISIALPSSDNYVKSILSPYGNIFRAQSLQDEFGNYIAILATATVLIAIILTSMQLGLGTSQLRDNNAFNSVSYGFTVFSILFVVASGAWLVLSFGVRQGFERMVEHHLQYTRREHLKDLLVPV